MKNPRKLGRACDTDQPETLGTSMLLGIQDPDGDPLARELAQLRLRERLERELRKGQMFKALIEDVMEINRLPQ
jgi:hypothetical protein